MNKGEKYNRVITGAISGLILPFIAFAVFYLATVKGFTPEQYYRRIINAGNLAQIMSVSVFANIIIFLIFNHFDMLRASKGVLGITIIWAFVVFGIKFL